MTVEVPLSFDHLSSSRAAIVKFVESHARSIEAFYDAGQNTFNIAVDQPRADDSTRAVRGLTSTFTCLESVLESGPTSSADILVEYRGRLERYLKLALTHPGDWRSEGSAWIYCRVRSLGAAARHAPELLVRQDRPIRALLDPVWSATDHKAGGAYGVRELTREPGEVETGSLYSPNAYLTYWTLFVSQRVPRASLPTGWESRLKSLSDWMIAVLTEQIAFHQARSPNADPQQLAWAIAATVLDAEPSDLVKNARKHDLISEGLRAFFEQQHERGDWDRGKPLFNYRYAGNAYCYPYETLAELLALATDEQIKGRDGFATMLKPFSTNLTRAFEYARDTALPLNGGRTELGWGSRHHSHRPGPESWATASVFRFAQRLRVLIGRWTSGLAQDVLDARAPRKQLSDLRSRGATWNAGYSSAGSQLACFWTLPAILGASSGTNPVVGMDPDELVLSSQQGRSAILYGPPGTGKTTLVESIAGALDWPFIEITPAQFLDSGLDRVSARADEIFRQMMELDRCVVLLDEIDELVQNRTPSAEALERFFTTTMLPRLAKLWEMGKILFFANTNNVLDIDSAIRRSQRFDAAILVLPPGSETKAARLAEAGKTLDESTMAALEDVVVGSATEHDRLVWYPLLRYDQLDALADALAGVASPVAPGDLEASLEAIGNALLMQDWSNSKNVTAVTKSLRKLVKAQRRLTQLEALVTFEGDELEGAQKVGVDSNGLPVWKIENPPIDIAQWAKARGFTLQADVLTRQK